RLKNRELSGPAPRECVALQSAGPWPLLTWAWRPPGDACHHANDVTAGLCKNAGNSALIVQLYRSGHVRCALEPLPLLRRASSCGTPFGLAIGNCNLDKAESETQVRTANATISP